MQILEINVGKNREVSLFVNKGGNIGENNETLLKFTVPEEFKNHYKYLDIIKNDKDKTQTVLDVGKNYEFTYILPAFLTENRELYLQLVMKLKDEIFLSNIFVIKFDESICATQYIADNSCDTIQYLMENKADNENVNLISCELSGKLCSNVYYDELGRIYKSIDKKVDKEEGKELSQNDYTNEEKEKLSVTKRNLELHIENKNNPHNVGKEQIGLGNVDNTRDLSKPVSIATQNALDLKADKDYVLNLESRMDNHRSNNILHITNDERNSWNNKVDKEEGKKLSTEDFTTALKNKLNALPTNDALKEKFNEKANLLQLTTDISNTHKITDSAEKNIVDIEFYRTNLIPYPYNYLKSSTTVNGITFTDNGDGTITINGTATATVYFNPTEKFKVVSGNTYYLSGGTADIAISYQQKKDGVGYDTTKVNADVVSVKATSSWNEIHIILDIPKGTTVDNVIVKPMISLTDSAYEPYIETPTVILYGKNLLNVPETLTFKSLYTINVSLPAGTYYLSTDSANYPEGKSSPGFTFSRNSVHATTSRTAKTSKVVLTKPETTIYVYANGVNYNDSEGITVTINKIMLESGTVATDYEPYKEVQTAQGNDALNLTMNYPNTTVICDCGCKVTYKADSTNAYYNLKNEQEILKQAIINLGGTI